MSALRWAALVVAVVAYLVAATYPFRWQIAADRANGLRIAPSGEWILDSAGIARTAHPPPWLDRAIESGSLAVTLEIKSSSPIQSGPARIFTISEDDRERNLTVGQQESDLIVRVRRPGSSENGGPALHVRDCFSPSVWRRVEVVVNATEVIVSVDGSVSAIAITDESTFRDWDPTFRAAIGNEINLWRPWLGRIRRAEVEVEGKTHDLLTDSSLARPETLEYFRTTVRWFLLARRSRTVDWGDALRNVIGFVPFGLFLALMFARRPRWVLFCAVMAMSLGMEVSQLFVGQRVPALTDLVFNGLGGWLGIVLASGFRGTRRVEGE
ncbi:MAG: VanZ family protein [Planctomycetota bacterium]